MKLLVTGGAGFIGGRVAKSLRDDGHEITVVDNLSTGFVQNVPDGCELVEMGAEDPRLRSRLASKKLDAILHAGGQASGEIGEQRPLDDVHWNVVSAVNLLSLAEACGIERFIYASSMGVYGLHNSDLPLKEEDAGHPISVYGTGKQASEAYMATYAQRGLTTISLRMFNVYGPGQNMENQLQGMLSIYVSQLIRGRHLVVRGSLERVRDFVYIDDVVAAWKAALLANPVPGFRAYNVASGVGSSVSVVISTLKEIVGEFEVEIQEATPMDQVRTVGCIKKIGAEFGWTPFIDLRTGLERFWDWASGS